MTPLGHQSALIYLMVVVSSSDGVMSEREWKTVGQITKALPIFHDFEEHRLVPVVQSCAALLREPDGIETVMEQAMAALPAHLRETAYWLALEVALSDARVMIEEIRVAETLRRALGLDRLVAAALERAARARYQVA